MYELLEKHERLEEAMDKSSEEVSIPTKGCCEKEFGNDEEEYIRTYTCHNLNQQIEKQTSLNQLIKIITKYIDCRTKRHQYLRQHNEYQDNSTGDKTFHTVF